VKFKDWIAKSGYTFHNYEPFAHQYDMMYLQMKHKRFYNFGDMGSMKTASVIWTFDILRYHSKAKRLLVIAPLSILESVWIEELKNIAPHLKFALMHGPKADRLRAISSNADVVVTNHDCVRNYYVEIINAKFDMIAIDECTAFKHWGSERSKSMKKICDRARSVIGMTGTPITTGAMDAYGLAKCINPIMLPTPYMTKFRNMVMYQITMYEYEHKPDWKKIVHETLQPSIYVKTEDCVNMPPITFETRRVTPHKDLQAAYKTMVKQQLIELASGDISAVNAGVKYGKLLQIANGAVIKDNGEIHRLPIGSKLNEVESVFHESGKKLIVFIQHIAVGTVLEEYFRDKCRCAFVYGDTKIKRRTEVFNDFQKGDLEMLIAQVSVAAHGLTLTSSSHICYFGPVMGVEKFLQSIARIRRTGQTRHQHIIKLSSCRVEEMLYDKLDSGKLNNQDILDMYKEL